jgi:hypothetical protein
MNPDRILDMLKLPREPPMEDSFANLVPIFSNVVGQLESDQLDHLSNDVWKQAGSICHPIEEYRNTEHGKANAHVGLWETSKANENQSPCWWSDNGKKPSDPSRPLSGLKVLDATRIIAAPIVSRGLAELGASVLRITSPSVPDATLYHPELNWGKWNASLDFTKAEDRQRMKELILECDVFISSYRPGALAKFGFDADDVLEMCKHREKGIIVVRMNSYGWNGPFQDRSGWQQISDAVSDNSSSTKLPFSDMCSFAAFLTSSDVRWAMMSPLLLYSLIQTFGKQPYAYITWLENINN